MPTCSNQIEKNSLARPFLAANSCNTHSCIQNWFELLLEVCRQYRSSSVNLTAATTDGELQLLSLTSLAAICVAHASWVGVAFASLGWWLTCLPCVRSVAHAATSFASLGWSTAGFSSLTAVGHAVASSARLFVASKIGITITRARDIATALSKTIIVSITRKGP